MSATVLSELKDQWSASERNATALSELKDKERRLISELEQTREKIRLESLCDACNRRGLRCGRLKYQGGLFCSIHASRCAMVKESTVKCQNRNGILIYTRDGEELDVDAVLRSRQEQALTTTTTAAVTAPS